MTNSILEQKNIVNLKDGDVLYIPSFVKFGRNLIRNKYKITRDPNKAKFIILDERPKDEFRYKYIINPNYGKNGDFNYYSETIKENINKELQSLCDELSILKPIITTKELYQSVKTISENLTYEKILPFVKNNPVLAIEMLSRMDIKKEKYRIDMFITENNLFNYLNKNVNTKTFKNFLEKELGYHIGEVSYIPAFYIKSSSTLDEVLSRIKDITERFSTRFDFKIEAYERTN